MTVMDVDINQSPENLEIKLTTDDERDIIIKHLISNKDICFKSQQKWEADLTNNEKLAIALDQFQKSKLNFLIKFGKYLKNDHLGYFQQFCQNLEPESDEINLVLKELSRNVSESSHHINVKNRRYNALMQMVKNDNYFSEIEMMKRNPLLYEQLVGQYLTAEEKHLRDKYTMDNEATFVKILMEGIERDNAEVYKKSQEKKEDDQMEEEGKDSSEDKDENSSEDEEYTKRSTSPVPSTSRWGEFEEDKKYRPKQKPKVLSITPQERMLLKEEFITTMYQNFLDGKDEDFNYEIVDNDVSYDNIEEMENDEEDKYFAADDDEHSIVQGDDESSEDELDIYMNALNQHPSVCQLSTDLERM